MAQELPILRIREVKLSNEDFCCFTTRVAFGAVHCCCATAYL